MYLKMKGIYTNTEPTLQFTIESKKLSAKKKKIRLSLTSTKVIYVHRDIHIYRYV